MIIDSDGFREQLKHHQDCDVELVEITDGTMELECQDHHVVLLSVRDKTGQVNPQ